MHSNRLEMKFLVLCVTLSVLFFANFSSAASKVTVTAAYDENSNSTVKFEIKQSIQLVCNITVTAEGDDDNKVDVDLKWEKNGTLVTSIDRLKNRLSLSHVGKSYKLMLISAEPNDGGNYTCVGYANGVEQDRKNISVESKIYVKLAKDTTVVEGYELKVMCKVYGTPTPQIVWDYKNVTYEHSKGRVILKENEDGIENAAFIIEETVLEDQDKLTCRGISKSSSDSSKPAVTTVRVRDKYAALWPFLGICAEVLVLCAIIFIYEKKRNKTELEESDTDQSPEQKNTPDHGGKESNLRHRQ